MCHPHVQRVDWIGELESRICSNERECCNIRSNRLRTGLTEIFLPQLSTAAHTNPSKYVQQLSGMACRTLRTHFTQVPASVTPKSIAHFSMLTGMVLRSIWQPAGLSDMNHAAVKACISYHGSHHSGHAGGRMERVLGNENLYSTPNSSHEA